MRPIKFRAWDNKERKMLNVTHLDWMKEASTGRTTERSEGYFGDNHRRKFSLDEVSLMQFTGLKDKNGKEIYEGDMNRSDDGRVSEVVFYAGGFYQKFSKTEYKHIGSFAPFDHLVIGSIYQNPELLTHTTLV